MKLSQRESICSTVSNKCEELRIYTILLPKSIVNKIYCLELCFLYLERFVLVLLLSLNFISYDLCLSVLDSEQQMSALDAINIQ